MLIKLEAPAGQWLKATGEYERIIAKALTAAMRQTAKAAAKAGNDVIHAAGFASRIWDLKVINYPKSGTSLLPEAWIHSKVNFEDIFEEGRTIQGNPLLWLPLPSVPLWPGHSTRQMSPKKFVETFGPVLVTIKRPGRPPMLGQKIRRAPKAQPFGRFASRAQLRRGAAGRGAVEVIPLFVGVPVAQIAKRFNVGAAIEKEVNETIAQSYLQNLERYEGR